MRTVFMVVNIDRNSNDVYSMDRLWLFSKKKNHF